ncbi:TonB-dependent receptor [Hymenobacter sp. BRD128]|uniref:TonB-dependent receptor n=1 Tax=Hymenobacter sp. BRD128 TaxID=2675878 RepID=UPI00156614F1|nr:carboxypeptidase regulatory-like domain-containing protein [Hymenobacter sp. BRD128]QKG56451.1 TonB-dependent receptor [Hymenobacter sp. BRD128]
MKPLPLFILLSSLPAAGPVLAQQVSAPAAAQTTVLTGTVRDAQGQHLELVVVGLEGQPGGATTDAQGRFTLRLLRPVSGLAVLVVRRLGYQTLRQPLRLPEAAGQPLRLALQVDARALGSVTVRARAAGADTREQASLVQLDPQTAKVLPSPFGDFNAILKTLPGVVSNNELTSTYNVRGGNYDENLLYVNGFEVYRPFLVTQAQQEGLSFINPDLVQKVDFSTGGWQPKYGDKLSSVLDIQYKEPEKFAASATASLVGAAVHTEARSAGGRVSYLAGVRYKNAQYVFNALKQNQGQYNPTFYDGQAYVNIGLGKQDNMQKTSLGILGVVAHNDYRFVPVSGQVTFSTAVNQFSRVNIYYDGRERMQYDTYQTGFDLRHNFHPGLQLDLLASALSTREFEFRDVEAAYTFADVNRDPSSPDFNQTVRQRNIGSSFNHARNDLTARVFTAELRGRWNPGGDPLGPHTVRFGVKIGRESIHDQIDEYSFADSAGYVPDARRTRLAADLSLLSTRTQGYVQHTWQIDSLKTLTYGVRAHYWTENQQLVISPRLQFSSRDRRHPERSWKLATGLYAQPPFYRELRNFQGQLNPELRAQKSLHFVVGRQVELHLMNRPFRLNTEAFYKYLTDVIPYEVDNVRLRYYATNQATAYAAGLETRLSGEFVKGVESWLSLGLLTTQEKGDTTATYDATGKRTGYQTLGYIRRPQDQRLTASIFFQDHLPDNPSVRGYVNLVFGTGLPFSPPGLPQYRGDGALTTAYQRVDIGFSKVVSLRVAPQPHLYSLESLWLGLEILNILGANNVAGYSYLQDVNGRTYAVPSYLSQRVVNLRAIARF